MMVIPAVDLMDGKCVQLVEGKPSSAQVVIEDAVGTALRWQEMGAKRLHLVDLDAALGSGDNTSLVERIISSLSIPVQVGGGIRDDARAERLLSAEASQLIVGTRAVTDPDWLTDLAARYPERLIVAVDARGNEISIRGWTDSSGIDLLGYVRKIEPLPLYGLLYTDISREGRLRGIEIAPIRRLVGSTGHRVIVAGGISSVEDIQSVAWAGAYGTVLGMAIYRGKIDLRDALERFG